MFTAQSDEVTSDLLVLYLYAYTERRYLWLHKLWCSNTVVQRVILCISGVEDIDGSFACCNTVYRVLGCCDFVTDFVTG